MFMKDKKGFTLLELLVTVAILGILGAIAFPMYRGYQKSAARAEATTNLMALSLCLEEYFAERGNYGVAGTYNWANSGGTDTISNWLPAFKPKKAAAGTENKFDYRLQVIDANNYLATATGRAGFIVSGEVLTLDEEGTKTGSWPK